MSILIFCRDGILRKSFHVRDPQTGSFLSRNIPVRAWEAAVDEHIFLKGLNSAFKLESGLTVRQLMENLAPWSDIMTGVASMDFPSFLDEVRRQPDQIVDDVSHIEISYGVTIQAVPQFEGTGIVKLSDGTSEFKIGRAVKTGRIDVQQGWDNAAILNAAGRSRYEGSESISLSFSPLSGWGHLPIVIGENAVLRDETSTRMAARFLGTRMALTRSDHPNVRVADQASKGDIPHEIEIDAPEPTFYATLVKGFLWDVGFHYSPVLRDEVAGSLRDQVSAIDEGRLEELTDDLEEKDQSEFQQKTKMLEAVENAAVKLGLRITSVPEEQDEVLF